MDEEKLAAVELMIDKLAMLRDQLEDLLTGDAGDASCKASLTDALDYVEDAISCLEDIV